MVAKVSSIRDFFFCQGGFIHGPYKFGQLVYFSTLATMYKISLVPISLLGFLLSILQVMAST